MAKLIIYGDIHGCYEEFILLRDKINPSKNDIEVCVGDIITKGKNSIKVLDFIINNDIKSVLGNHEDKIIRYLEHSKINKRNPIELDIDEQSIVKSLSNEHKDFLKKIPLFIRFGQITIVHAGVQNSMKLEQLSKREKQKILRIRYVNEDETYIVLGEEDDNSIFWSDIYNGKEGFIVYGHQPFKNIKENKYALGIDTGCVYGNKLTAAVFTSFEKEFLSFNLFSQDSLNKIKE